MAFVLYSDLIDAALSEAARKAFQMLPQGYEFQSETVRKSIEKGQLAGQLTANAAAVLDVLDARGLVVTNEQRDRILGCSDLEALRRWLRSAVTVTSTDALFD